LFCYKSLVHTDIPHEKCKINKLFFFCILGISNTDMKQIQVPWDKIPLFVSS